jgi:hypothetical protein
MNSDAAEYGGSGYPVDAAVSTEAVPYHGFEQSIVVALPPLAMLVLQRPAPAVTEEAPRASEMASSVSPAGANTAKAAKAPKTPKTPKAEMSSKAAKAPKAPKPSKAPKASKTTKASKKTGESPDAAVDTSTPVPKTPGKRVRRTATPDEGA